MQRKIYESVKKSLFATEEKKPVVVIYGPRQVGKTTMLKRLQSEYPESVYYNAEYPDIQDQFSYKNIATIERILAGKKMILLDEAQQIRDIGKVLKIIVDHHPYVQIVATGSSSFDLSNKITEPLTGRKKVFHLYPFAACEVWDKKDVVEKKTDIENLLRFGSYPSVYLEKNESQKHDILYEITQSYLFKDIFTFQDLKKPEILSRLLKMLAFQVGSEVSYQELSKKLQISNDLVQKYIYLLEEAFVIFRLSAFSRNLRNELHKTRKIYFWDTGIRNMLIQNTNEIEYRNDVGALWENFVIAERQKYLAYTHQYRNTYFWRTYDRKEIDYIEEYDGKLDAYEIKWNTKVGKKTKIPKLFLETYENSNFKVIDQENVFDFVV